jgi:hypothetical protein
MGCDEAVSASQSAEGLLVGEVVGCNGSVGLEQIVAVVVKAVGRVTTGELANDAPCVEGVLACEVVGSEVSGKDEGMVAVSVTDVGWSAGCISDVPATGELVKGVVAGETVGSEGPAVCDATVGWNAGGISAVPTTGELVTDGPSAEGALAGVNSEGRVGDEPMVAVGVTRIG